MEAGRIPYACFLRLLEWGLSVVSVDDIPCKHLVNNNMLDWLVGQWVDWYVCWLVSWLIGSLIKRFVGGAPQL